MFRALTIARALASLVRPRREAGTPVRRILVAHYLLLGDTILLAPLLKSLAARYPDAERVVLARPAVATLFGERPYGVTVLPFDRRDAASHRAVIDSGPYDLAIVPDDNRYAWLARAAGARRVVGFANDRPGWKNWMLDRAIPYPEIGSAWADIAARHLTDDLAAAEPPPHVVGEWPAPAFATFARPPRPYVVLHIGASTPLKQWPAGRWVSIAAKFRDDGLAIVWSGGAGERHLLDAIFPTADDVDLMGVLDLPQLWHLLAGAQLLVCPDTGIAHLARLTGVPTVALFGPGSALIHGPGRFWSGSAFRTVTIEDFPCRDQPVLFRRRVDWARRCGRRFDPGAQPGGGGDASACGQALCMNALRPQEVVSAVDDMHEARPSGRAAARDCAERIG